MAKKPIAGITKAVDEEYMLTRPRKGAKLKEEVWTNRNGEIVKYSLAYINPRRCAVDHGRVLGYDNSHDGHHRHCMGMIESVAYTSYQALYDRFVAELQAIWGEEDDQR